MKKYVIKLNGKVYEVEMGEAGSVATTTNVPPVVTHTAAPAPTVSAPVAGGETVIAPMPGNILNVMVKAGDVVKKNQVLLVLEAMKMENEIVSPIDGTILSVTASKGTAVNVSEELVRIG
jgi:biotin carboxyl carrier protein